MRKPTPFEDRPTWQRVKDLSEAAMYATSAISSLLLLWEHIPKNSASDHVAETLRDVAARLNDARGMES